MSSRARHRTARRADAGVIAPASAILLSAAIGLAGLVTDVGVWFAQRRSLQGITDAAALAASPYAANAATARTHAETIFTANGLDPATTLTAVETGWYCQDTTLPASARFSATRCVGDPANPANAVRLTTRADAPLILSRIVAGPNVNSRAITVAATAARINQAGMEAGVGTAQLNQGLANAVLTSLTGGSGVSLTLLQYQGLMNARVDALEILDALALKTNVGAGTYDQVLASNVGVGDLLDAAIQVLGKHPEVAGAGVAISGLQVIRSQVVGSPQIALGKLIDLGVWDKLKVGHAAESETALRAGLNVYQLATFGLQLANQHRAASVKGTDIGVPGLANLSIEATAVEPPQRAYFAYGPQGLSVHSAAVRVKLALDIVGLAKYLGVGVKLPLYVEVAGGDAQLTAISCSGAPATDTRVTVSARGGVADAYIGTLPNNLMTNFSRPVTEADIASVNVVSLNLLRLDILTSDVAMKSHVRVGSPTSSWTTLTFVQPPGPAQTGMPGTTGVIGRSAADKRGALAPIPARAISQNMGTALVGGLVQGLEVESCTLGLFGLCIMRLPLSGSAIGPLFTLLSPILTALEAPVDALLKALGINVGYIDVFVTGVRCGAPVLVD